MFRPDSFSSKAVRALLILLALASTAFAQFETRGNFPALPESGPWSATIGDFNGDGILDLAVINYCCGGSGVSILLGNGNGTFQPPTQYSAGEQPFTAVAADFNGDRITDLVVANSLSDYLSILIGNGDGTFQPATQSPRVHNAAFIAIADVNGDGKPDLITLGEAQISVLIGRGDGTFRDAVVTRPPFSIYTIGVGDFDGDGNVDLITAGQFGSQRYIHILLGNGDGTFRRGAQYGGESSPESIVVADFNGDHKLDFAVANFEGLSVSVWLGHGDGTFDHNRDYSTPFPMHVEAADLDGDGTLDLVAANFFEPAGATVFTGNGAGQFRQGKFYPAGRNTRFVGIADFNGDHQLDLLVPDILSSDVIVLLNTGVVAFEPTQPVAFEPQLLGTTSDSQTVTLTNKGRSPLSIKSITVNGPFPMTQTCGALVPAGASCDFVVSFAPTAQGHFGGVINIHDSASSKPQIIQLAGAGTVIDLSPPRLDFGNQPVGTMSDPLPVTVTNRGSAPVDIGNISVQDNFHNYFHQTNNCPPHLRPAAACTISVTFKPTIPGDLSAVLLIDDSGGGDRQSVPLSGTGVDRR